MNFRNLRILHKILALLGMLAALTVCSALFIGMSMSHVSRGFEQVMAGPVEANLLLQTAEETVTVVDRVSLQVAVSTSDAENARLFAVVAAAQGSRDTLIAQAAALLPDHAAEFRQITALAASADRACAGPLKYAASVTTDSEDVKAAHRLEAECERPLQAVGSALQNLTGEVHSAASAASVGATTTASNAMAYGYSVTAAGLLVVFSIAVWVSRATIVSPLNAMTSVMERLASGNLEVKIPSLDRRDEIGSMAQAVEVFKTNMQETSRLREQQEELRVRAATDRRQTMNDLVGTFETRVGGIVEGVSAQATELQATAQSMAATAEETSRQTAAVAAASEQATHNVNTVAAATEELSASVAEIMQQITLSTREIGDAVTEATGANHQMQGLSESVRKIGEVVTLINNIASQTNLLALNATIEAARAGDAGKGFAVVASEVKALAGQTAKATEVISSQVAAIQEVTKLSVQSIQNINSRIARVSETATAIASAVEEQGAATREIARNVAEAAKGTSEVSSNIAGVSEAAGQTGASAAEVLASASDLSQNSEALRAQVGEFLSEVRAA